MSLTIRQLYSQLLATLGVLKFQDQAIERYDASVRAVLQSFTLWVLILPASLYASYIAERGLLVRYELELSTYLGWRAGAVLASAVLPWLPVWLMCSWEGLQPRFTRLVVSQNWLILLTTLLIAGLNGLTQNVLFTKTQIMAMGITAFTVQLLYAWYFCWLALRCNPFYAAGIATMLFMIASTCGDLVNVHLFGSMRPLYAQEVVDVIQQRDQTGY